MVHGLETLKRMNNNAACGHKLKPVSMTPFEAVSRIGLGQKFAAIKDQIDFSRGCSAHEFQLIVSGASVYAIAEDSKHESELQKLVKFVDAAIREINARENQGI